MVLQIEQNEMLRDYMERVARSEYFVKMDYLCRHKAFNELNMLTISRLAKDMLLLKCSISEYVLRKGDISDAVHIVVRGAASITFKSSPTAVQNADV